MRVIIAGGRDFNDYDLMKRKLDALLANQTGVVIVSGACPTGADKLGERYALERKLPVVQHPADWKQHGKSAGPRRNEQMAQNADALVAFWDGKSRGTKNMIDNAEKYGLKVRVVMYEIKVI